MGEKLGCPIGSGVGNKCKLVCLQYNPEVCAVFYWVRIGAVRIGSSMLSITGRMLGGWRRCCVQPDSTCSRRFLPVRPRLWWWSMNKETLCRTENSYLSNFWRCGRIVLGPQSWTCIHTHIHKHARARFLCRDCEWHAERERNFNDRISSLMRNLCNFAGDVC